MRGVVRSGLVALPAGLGGAIVPATAATVTVTATTVTGTSPENDGASPTAMTIARWNGSGWRRAHEALPKGTRSVDLHGVSCRTAKSCLVVGDYYTSANSGAAGHALALTYNGTSLRPTAAVPLPQSAAQAVLSGVSCTTAAHCVGVTASASPRRRHRVGVTASASPRRRHRVHRGLAGPGVAGGHAGPARGHRLIAGRRVLLRPARLRGGRRGRPPEPRPPW